MMRLTLRNEFAHVYVELDETALGPRLKICDVRTRQVTYLDPLELESLVWCCHKDLKYILDPAFRRWSDRDEDYIELFQQGGVEQE